MARRRDSSWRFLCWRHWTPRPYKPPPLGILAAKKSNFRHTGAKKSKYKVVPQTSSARVHHHHHHHHAARTATDTENAYARARRLPCYGEYVAGVDGAGARDNGAAALFAAAHVGDLALVEALLEAGFFLNARGPRDETALIAAARAGHRDVVEFLFDRGADMTAVDKAGQNAADHARFAGHGGLSEVLHEFGSPNVEVVD